MIRAGSLYYTCDSGGGGFLDDLGDLFKGFFDTVTGFIDWVSSTYNSAKGALLTAVINAVKATVGCGS